MRYLGFFVILPFLPGAAAAEPVISVSALRCEYRSNPLGIDVRLPRLSWVVRSDLRGQRQTAYRVLVASSAERLAAEEGDLWDSGKVLSDQTLHVVYSGKPLESGKVCHWSVQVWDNRDRPSARSRPAFWSMGLLDRGDWKARWIADQSHPIVPPSAPDKGPHAVASHPPAGHAPAAMLPATMVRKEFSVSGPVRRATAYVTGLGLYELRLNGRRVGDHLLTPEWTTYDKRIQYQTYDVTNLVKPGANAVGALLGEGWYAGPMMLKPALLDPSFRLLMRLDVELADGRTETIVTDPTWQGTTEGPLRRSGIYFGETYDATREMPGWDQPGFQGIGWLPVAAAEMESRPLLAAQKSEPIRVVEELRPVKVTEPKPHVFVFDMGRNMVGWCRLKVHGPRGAKVTLRHAEMLDTDGMVYTANLRGAAQINEYTLAGHGPETFEPHFTYHGFRYVELAGLNSRPDADALVGRVFCTSSPEVSHFECSDPLANRLMSNIFWTQRANLMSAPTDCPQRTEREGWMGDIQAFSQTAIFHMELAGFFSKWVQDIRDSQAADGRYPDMAPHPADPNQGFSGTPAWGDAGIVVPWRMYENYGDTRLLEEHFASARRWIDYIRGHNPDLLWRNSLGGNYGDWLNGDTLVLKGYPRGISAVPSDVLATAFFAQSTGIVAKMAKVLGRGKEAAAYGKLAEDIRRAFQKAYVAPDGRIRGDTQAGYVLALNFHLIEEADRPKAVEHLLAAIQRYKAHPSTGIQTTHRLMMELTDSGRHDEALRLLSLKTVPSWGFMIEQDATTIWERWDGFVPGRGFQDPGMNSFNHWAFGSVGEWVWREIVGLNPDEARPGYAHFVVRPRIAGHITWARGRYDSVRGRIAIDWKREGEKFSLDVTVPANTTASVHVAASDAANVTEGGQPANKAEGVKFIRADGGDALYEVVSGRYKFESSIRP